MAFDSKTGTNIDVMSLTPSAVDIDAAMAEADAEIAAEAAETGEEASEEVTLSSGAEVPEAKAESETEGEEADEEDSGEDSEDADEEDNEGDTPPAAVEPDKDVEEFKKLAGDPKKTEARVIKAKVADATGAEKDLDIPLTAKWTVGQGEDAEVVTTRDLLRGYGSRAKNEAKEREVVARERGAQAQIEAYNQTIQQFATLAQGGRAVEAFNHLVRSAGVDPLKAVRAFRTALVRDAEEYLKLPAEQRLLLEEREEADYLKKENERLVQARTVENQNASLEREVGMAIQHFGFRDRNEFGSTYRECKQFLEEQVQNGAAPIEITPAVVGQFYQGKQKQAMLESVLGEVDPALLKDSDAVTAAVEFIKAKNPSRDQLLKVVKATYGSKSAAPANGTKTNGVAKPQPKLTKPVTKPVGLQTKGNSSPSKKEDFDPGTDIDRTPDVSRNWKSLVR